MSGVVRHRPDGTPIECLHVALADSLDRTVAHAVTDSAGMFVLVAPDTGSFRVEFDMPGLEPLTGPLVRLAAGELNEQEYPLSFDRRIPGELELIGSTRQLNVVDLGDWHPVDFNLGVGHPAAHAVSAPEMVELTNKAVDLKRLVAEFIVDPTGRPRAASWRTIVSSDPNILTRARADFLARHYAPARIGEERICQLVMIQMRSFRTGPAGKPMR